MHLDLLFRQAPKEAPRVREEVRVSLDLAAVVVPKASDVLAARLREMILVQRARRGYAAPARTRTGRAIRTEPHLGTRGVARAGNRRAGADARRPQWRLAGAAAGPRTRSRARSSCSCAATACGSRRCSRRAKRSSRPRRGSRRSIVSDADLAEMTRIHQALDTGFRRRRRACAAQPAMAPRRSCARAATSC